MEDLQQPEKASERLPIHPGAASITVEEFATTGGTPRLEECAVQDPGPDIREINSRRAEANREWRARNPRLSPPITRLGGSARVHAGASIVVPSSRRGGGALRGPAARAVTRRRGGGRGGAGLASVKSAAAAIALPTGRRERAGGRAE
jgi:hypothetical protein